jgi:uncharacterized protein YcaQ
VRLDQWVAGWKELNPGDALREVVRRYLRAYGPARPDDFGHWIRMPAPDARQLFESMRDELTEVDVDGFRAWLLVKDVRFPESAELPGWTDLPVRLLPDYDCFVIGAAPPGRPREQLIPTAAGTRVFNRGAGPSAVLLVDGAVAGVWKRRSRGKRVEVLVEPFRRLVRAERQGLEAEADRLELFLEAPVELRVGPIA